ncbi:unnamed protein product [Larinioides sclopetarius]|uniref:Uncharacterized protein n=1 Tax=Larinioides sclopetarius TaxID=280406 RepID=A0AAV2A0J6_9ARAC
MLYIDLRVQSKEQESGLLVEVVRKCLAEEPSYEGIPTGELYPKKELKDFYKSKKDS